MALTTLQSLIDGLADGGEQPAIIAHRPDRPVVWSRQLLGETARRLAAGLLGHGVKPGEVIGLLGPGSPEWIAGFLGTVRAGALAMPINEHASDLELDRVLAHSNCRRVISSAARLKSFAALECPLREIVVLEDDAELEPIEGLCVCRWSDLLGEAPARLPELAADRPAALLYTSGTTGTPKGVPLTHQNLCSNVEALLAARLATPEDRAFVPLPLHHTYPLTVGVLAPLAVGAPIVLPAGITGPQINRALKECRATIMIGVPRLYEALIQAVDGQVRARGRLAVAVFRGLLALSIALRRRLGWRIGRLVFGALHRQIGPTLHLLASGGAKLDPEISWRLEGLGWQVLTGYGLTETAPILTFNQPGRVRLETAGRPVDGVELRIAHQEGGDPAHGEVQARGPNVFAGYFDNPEATRESFTEDGFFRTGDLGYLDADGFLHLVGRSKELIVLAGGKNVFPEDVEAVYGEIGLAREMAVLEHKDRLVGVFVPAADATRGRSLEQLSQEMRDEVAKLSQKLPSYERLADFAITREPLPRTQIGKLRRHELPEIYRQEKSESGRPKPAPVATAADRELIATPPASEIWSWLEQRFQGQTLTLDTSPQFDLSLDSFDWMSLTMELEERFGVRLSEDALGRVVTLRDLLKESLEAGASAEPSEAEMHRLSPEQEPYLEPRGRAMMVFAWLLYWLNRALMRSVFRVHAEGLEHLPADGPLLIAPNHASYLDPFAIGAALPWRRTRNLQWAGWTGLLFRGPLTRLFSRAAQVVPVDSERGLTSTLALGRAVLERGGQLVWFPEGARSTDGAMHGFLPGVGLLLEKTGARAVPVLIEGAYQAWPPGRSLPRLHPIAIRFGEPLDVAQLKADAANDRRHAAMAERLRAAVQDLGAAGAEPPQAAP